MLTEALALCLSSRGGHLPEAIIATTEHLLIGKPPAGEPGDHIGSITRTSHCSRAGQRRIGSRSTQHV